jgi:hypothetical protein
VLSSTPTLVTGVYNQNSGLAGSDIQVPATLLEVIVTLSKSRERQLATNHNNNNNDIDIGSIDQMSLPAHPLGTMLMLILYANSTRRSASSSAHSKSTRHSASSSNLVPKAISKASKPTGIQKKTYSRQKPTTDSLFSTPRNLIGDLYRSSQGFS